MTARVDVPLLTLIFNLNSVRTLISFKQVQIPSQIGQLFPGTFECSIGRRMMSDSFFFKLDLLKGASSEILNEIISVPYWHAK